MSDMRPPLSRPPIDPLSLSEDKEKGEQMFSLIIEHDGGGTYSYLINEYIRRGHSDKKNVASTFIIRLICNIDANPSVSQVLLARTDRGEKQSSESICIHFYQRGADYYRSFAVAMKVYGLIFLQVLQSKSAHILLIRIF